MKYGEILDMNGKNRNYDMQNPTEIPKPSPSAPGRAFSPASSSRLLRIACNAASEPRRQAGDRSIVRTLRPALAALPGGGKRGQSWG